VSDQFGDMSEYPSYPVGSSEDVPARPAPPTTVANAVWLMYARAALGLIGALAGYSTRDTLKDKIVAEHPEYDKAKVDQVLNAALVLGIAIAVIIAVLYVLLAIQVRNGKNWARIVTLVLAAFGLLSFPAVLAQIHTSLTILAGALGALLNLGILVLLLLPPSNAYFRR
jgi:H+/Cl- antiporter ClcA